MDDERSAYFFDSDLPELHPSVLFSIPLVGAGSGGVESLYGYLTRLALAHRVPLRELIVQVIRPVLGKLGGGKWIIPASETKCRTDMLGVGPEVELWTNLLSNLTGVRDLASGTMHWLRSCISDDELISGVPKYCQICMLEGLVSGTSDHDPLLMNLETIAACPKHHVRLNLRLCRASREAYLPLRQRVNHPGVCKACGKVGYTCNSMLPESASIKEIRKAIEIEKLVMFGAAGGIADSDLLRLGLQRFLTDDVEIRSNRLMRTPESVQFEIDRFMARRVKKISLRTLLDLCIPNKVSPLSVLNGKPVPVQRSLSNKALPMPYRGSVLPEVAEKEVRTLLDHIEKPVSVLSIERRLGLDRGILRTLCPDLEKELRRAYAEARRRKRLNKQTDLARECSEVIKVLRLKRQVLSLPNLALMTNGAWGTTGPKAQMFLQMSASLPAIA